MLYKKSSIVVFVWLTISAPLYSQKKADLSNFVVVGDSLSAGYQNAQLIASSQVHGYANVIATQAGLSLNLPLVPSPGYPQIVLKQNFAVPVGVTDFPTPTNTQPTLDLAVPGFTVGALVGLAPLCNPPLTDFLFPVELMAAKILNPGCSKNPKPELTQGAKMKPTTSILWVGSNDVLFTVYFGTPPTDPATFGALFNTAATTMAQASGNLVLANIPDVTLTAYLTSVPKLAAILGLPVSTVEAALGLQPGDMVTPYAFQAIQAMGLTPLTNPAPPAPPLVIRAATVLQIRAYVVAYNILIAYEAAINGATLVDIYSLVNNLAANGIVVGGRKLTTDFLGGLFSLDGVHPTNTGYAIIANEFIRTMNQSLRTNIPTISLEDVAKNDPLIFPAGSSAISTSYVGIEMADGLRALGGQ